MNNNLMDDLPKNFAPYKDKIVKTQRPSILLQLHPASNLPIWQSKIGGKPYLPLEIDYPQNEDGYPLQLIAQINFAELPNNELYPKTGILQFYIDAQDDVWGLNFEDQCDQTGFRVLYHEQVLQDENQLHQFDEHWENEQFDQSPISGEYAISFHMEQQLISLVDKNFAKQILLEENLYESEKIGDEDYDAYTQLIDSSGHRLGGYPFFTQEDPRHGQTEDYVLLLQLDTEEHDDIDIMWGDLGVANFFIHPEDLKNKDFSKVMYNWDCH